MILAPASDQYNAPAVERRQPAPTRLVISRLGITAPIEALGLNVDYSLQAPAGIAAVGWYRLGPAPGAPGDAIISGHRGYAGGVPAVFSELARLHPGDPVQVQRADGSIVVFVVTRVYVDASTKVPAGFFAIDGPPRLTLVTCTGDFDGHSLTYNQRLIVEAMVTPDAAATARRHGEN